MRTKLILIAIFLLAGIASSTMAQDFAIRGTLNLPGRTAIDAVGDLAFTGGTNNFAIVDLSNPNSPSLRGQVTPNSAAINAIEVRGNYAYCAGGTTGLVIINITNPTSPAWAASLTLGSPALGVAARDTLVAVAGVGGITLVGARDAAHPHVLTALSGQATWVEFDSQGNGLHVGSDNGVRRLAIQTHISGGDTTYSLSESASYGSSRLSPVSVCGSYLDCAGLAVLTAIDVHSYDFAGQYTAPAAIRCVAGGNNFSFIGLANASVYFIDQRSAAPQFVSGVTVGGAPTGVALANDGNDLLVVVAHSGGVTVCGYDPLAVDNPEAPIIPQDFSVQAYPNPFNSVVELQIDPRVNGVYTVGIFDLLGREIHRGNVTAFGTTTYLVNFASFSAGHYVARIMAPTGRSIQTKLVYLP